ncbi:MAG TPA: hypothetical protein VFU05_02345 [Cyclobacteriaceae bacterium]|nr:hypothetical protein [Cyclobacteriaceae bacterium]
MSVKSSITELFAQNKELTIKEIVDKLGVSKQMVHIVIKQLVEDRFLEKLGRTPKTIYRLVDQKKTSQVSESLSVYQHEFEFLKQNFMVVTETGAILEGLPAFDYWCGQRKLPVKKTLEEFISTKKKYQDYYENDGIINGIEKLRNTKGYEKIWLDQLYYLDFYAIERFGKTKLGTLLHFAKQGQNKMLMAQVIRECSDRIKNFLIKQHADSVCFIPPTIRREVQFMKYLQTHLKIALPHVEIKKISGIIPVPQKSLSKIEERIKNADNTFAVTESRNFNHVILIDDAVGSGATLNQIARKIKEKKIARRVTGLCLVGSFKGFDVITDI